MILPGLPLAWFFMWAGPSEEQDIACILYFVCVLHTIRSQSVRFHVGRRIGMVCSRVRLVYLQLVQHQVVGEWKWQWLLHTRDDKENAEQQSGHHTKQQLGVGRQGHCYILRFGKDYMPLFLGDEFHDFLVSVYHAHYYNTWWALHWTRASLVPLLANVHEGKNKGVAKVPSKECLGTNSTTIPLPLEILTTNSCY